METKHFNSCTIFFAGLIFSSCTTLGQFNHKKPWPTYSLQNMPHTRFTCHDKILGGYYADPETQCQMFHVCVKVAGVGVQDFRFLCPNGTAFDQEAQICADWGDVDCEQAVLYYGSDNFDLYRLGSGFESKRAPLAEEEEATFHLQRAETGDIRQSKETRVDQKQSYIKKIDKFESTDRNAFYGSGNSESRKSNYDQNNDFKKVSPKFEAPKKTTSSYYTTPRANDFNSNIDLKQDGDELFKGSHSSNFFANRNAGREDDLTENIQPSTVRTTTINQFFSGSVPRKEDFRNLEATTKRPHRGRRPTQTNSQLNVIPSSTDTTTTLYSTFPTTTVQDIQRETKRLTVQSHFNTGLSLGNDKPPYRSTTSPFTTSTPSPLSVITQRTSSATQRYQFGANDYHQDIHPTTYNPSGAFRYKTTTQRYDDINETTLRGEKPAQGSFANSQHDSQNLEIFSRVSNRKSQNTERNIQKQQAKNITLANRNEFTDFTKKKIPTGFQLSSRAQQNSGPANLAGLSPNVQPLDPGKLNSELRNINQAQQPSRGRGSGSRFNNRQQAEPQYFRTKSYETPAPFTAPQSQQQPGNFFHGSGNFQHLPKHEQTSNFNSYNNPQIGQKESTSTRSEKRAGNATTGESLPSTAVGRTRNQQRLGGDFTSPQSQHNLNGERQRSGSQFKQLESTYNAYNPFSRNKVESKSENLSDTTPTANATPSPRGRGYVSYKANAPHQGRSIENFVQTTASGIKKFSTLVPKDQYQPTTFKPTVNTKNAFDQKPKKSTDAKSRGPPYVPSTTQLPSTIPGSLSTIDEHDGQYHPELYEIDYTRNNVAQTKKPFEFISSAQSKPHTTTNHHSTSNPPLPYFQSQQHSAAYSTPTDLSDEEELFKTAHSLNLGAASINKLRADTLKTVDKTSQQSSPNFDKTPNPAQQPFLALTITWRPPTTFIAASTSATRTPSPSTKPKPKSKSKSKSSSSKRPPHADVDTSYDYAYYDSLSETPQEYPEYDLIADFRKTKNH